MSKPILAFASVKAPFQQWHNKLGHRSNKILNNIISAHNLPLSSSVTLDLYCNVYNCNKSYKIPFNVSSLRSNSPLELIYSDVWGRSPIPSLNGFNYYVIFVDHYTKYIWLFPIKRKSNIALIFTCFKLVVEKFFQCPIISTYTDGGGEFQALKSFIESHGIFHFLTPSHTLQHNGSAERCHHHLVETRLTLLNQASLPL